MIITLTTDFGLEDPYVAAMKGVILGIHPEALIVDVTHVLRPHAIDEAAFVLKQAVSYFPAKTIHVAVVDPGVGTDRAGLLVLAGGQSFLAPDNGLLQYVFDAHPDAVVYKLTRTEFVLKPTSPTFHGRDVFAPIAAHLANGEGPEAFGEPFNHFNRGAVRKPVVGNREIKGEILLLDRFGNAVTNIEARFLDVPLRMEVSVGRFRIRGLSRTYADSPSGKPLALIGSHGHLEIAINQGNAEKAMRLRKGTAVTVRLK